MIVLHGMSDRQTELLDIMWSLDTEEELLNWQKSLLLKDFQMVEVLKELILLESIEQEILTADMSLTQSELEKIMYPD